MKNNKTNLEKTINNIILNVFIVAIIAGLVILPVHVIKKDIKQFKTAYKTERDLEKYKSTLPNYTDSIREFNAIYGPRTAMITHELLRTTDPTTRDSFLQILGNYTKHEQELRAKHARVQKQIADYETVLKQKHGLQR